MKGWTALAVAMAFVWACERDGPATAADSGQPVAAPPAPEANPEPKPASVALAASATINDAFAAGTPTFVRGTQGSEIDDLRIATQIDLVRTLVFPDASVVDDVAVEPGAWPERPVLYGGHNLNALVGGLDPFGLTVDATQVQVGETILEGDDLRVIARVPASASHPSFVWYAGTGSAGVAEINAGIPTNHPLVVADRFGLLATGHWTSQAGKAVPVLGERRRRIEYRTVGRTLFGFERVQWGTATFAFPSMVEESENDTAKIDAMLAGLEQVTRRLVIRDPGDLRVYVYPDRRSKQELTDNGGDGHAVPSSRTLHVLALEPEVLQPLVAHEGTHVLGYRELGPAATPLMGEGLAVWVSGSYGGTSIDDWKSRLEPVPIAELLGPGWSTLPEAQRYPLAAIAFAAALELVGLAAVKDHLMRASPQTWADACKAAGTSSEALEAKYREVFAR